MQSAWTMLALLYSVMYCPHTVGLQAEVTKFQDFVENAISSHPDVKLTRAGGRVTDDAVAELLRLKGHKADRSTINKFRNAHVDVGRNSHLLSAFADVFAADTDGQDRSGEPTVRVLWAAVCRARDPLTQVDREAVRAVHVDRLDETQTEREMELFERELAAEVRRPVYFGYVAPPDVLLTLGSERPLSLDSLNELASALDRPSLALPSQSAELDKMRSWFDAFLGALDAKAGQRNTPSADLTKAIDLHSGYLGRNASKLSFDIASNTNVVVILAGRRTNRARAARAAEIYTKWPDGRQSTIIVFGAPADRIDGSSLLGEVDAAYLDLKRILPDLPAADLRLDQRCHGFRDAAALLVGHLLRDEAFDSLQPHRLALVAGNLSSRRAWMLFDHQIRLHRHLVSEIVSTVGVGIETHYSPRQTVDERKRWHAVLVAETEKLLLTRLVGEA